MAEVDTASQATDLHGAAAAFSGLLERAANPVTEPESQPPPAEVPQATEALGQSQGPETAPEGEGSPQEAGPQEEVPAVEEGAPEAPAELPKLVTVKVNGKTEDLPLEEVVKGYQRQADYSQKTAAVAEERRALQQKAQQVAQQEAQYAQLLPALIQQWQALQPKAPDQTLLETDPVQYIREERAYRDSQEKIAAAQFELNRIQQAQTQEQRGKLQQTIAESRQKMVEAIPHWKDPAKWDADRVKLLDYGKKLGFTDEELAQVYDHRPLVAVYKAMKYDELMAAKPRPTPQPAPQVAPAGSAQSAPRRVSDATRAKQRLAQTGSVQDAAAIFARFSNI